MKTKLYAFWKYDLFPYVLGGEVANILPDGLIETVGFGKGYYFKPILYVPYTQGKEIAASLEQIRNQRDEEINKLNKKYNEILHTKYPQLFNN